MLKRPLILATIIGASVGVPYVMSRDSGKENGNWWPSFAGKSDSASAGSVSGLGELPRVETTLAGPGSSLYQSRVPIEGVRTQSLAEVFSMDVTREWVLQRWARKTTGLTDPELFGIRVPLVTGTGLADLAGSLSYYFNSQGQVQRISFYGWTGDASKLVQYLTTTYGFRQEQGPFPGEHLYQVTWSGKVQSRLRTRPDTVVWSTSPHNSVQVELELERPGSNRYLPDQNPLTRIPELAAVPASPSPQSAEPAAANSAESKSGDSNDEGAEGEEGAKVKVDLPPRRRWGQ